MVAAFALAAGLLFVASTAVPARAASPHVRATIDTSICAACHSVHTATNPMLTRTGMDTDGVTASCLGCHGGSDQTASNIAVEFTSGSGHSLTAESSGTVQLNGCDTCHDVHGASEDARGIPAKKVNGVVVSSAGKELCLACHDESDAWFGPGYPSTSAPTRDATGYPVAGTWTGSNTYESPTNAHRLIPETTRTAGQNDPVRREQGDCLYCHAAHGSSNAYDGLIATYTVPSQATLASDQADGSYAALCFECHGGKKPSGFAEKPIDIKQFTTASATASNAPGGHSIVTSGGTLPVGSPLPCFECHNPHGSKRGNASMLSDERGESLSATGNAGVRQFCFTCHTTSDTTAGWDSATTSFTVVPPAEKVVGIPRDGGVLHLSAIDGHAQGDSQSCYECHGNSYDADGNNVHNPDSGQAVAGFSLALDSVPDTSTVPTGGVDASGSIDATVALSAVTATDTTPPLTTSDAVATYTVEATITLSAVDDTGGVGVADTYWTLDGGDVATGTVVATSAVGPHELTFWSVDLSGNVESSTVTSFTIDADRAMALPVMLAARLGQVIADAGS